MDYGMNPCSQGHVFSLSSDAGDPWGRTASAKQSERLCVMFNTVLARDYSSKGRRRTVSFERRGGGLGQDEKRLGKTFITVGEYVRLDEEAG